MIVRVVRMHFRPGETDRFLEIFNENKVAIRNFPGCTHLELLKDAHSQSTFTTLSYWRDSADLEAYRKSTLFSGVWTHVKKLFSGRPEAFTFTRFMEVKGGEAG
jgi:quinol monooxygenase YgiN